MLQRWFVGRKRSLSPILAALASGLLAILVPAAAGLGEAPAYAGSVTVGQGETLSSIAARYHTTVAALAAANDITNANLVYSGAVLRLPSSGRSSTSVTVGPGETLSQIAQSHGTTVTALAAANDITNLNLVYAGQVLVVPGPTSSPSGGATGATGATVIVGPGQSLTSIAARYGVSVSELAAANGITNPNLVFAGAHLQIPSQSMALASYPSPGSGQESLPAQLVTHPSRLALRGDFVSSARAYGLPASLLEALCWWESGWQQSVVSSTGAIGVCQIEPSTANFVDTVLYPGRGLNINSARGNISVAAAYLHNLLRNTKGSQALALAAYYQGLTSVAQVGLLPTTRNYVAGILAYARVFAAA